VLLGNGNGTFQSQRISDAGTNPRSLTLGDVNGDGLLDIMTANFGSTNASVLLGKGDGTFQTAATFATGTNSFSATLGDVNGDGRLDIIAANYNSDNVSVLLGTGGSAITATFSPQQTFATGASPRSVAMGDVNKDGKLDLITANYNSSTASVLLGDGSGTFQTKVDFTTGGYPKFVTLGDVNSDGKLDLITANDYDPTVSVLLGNGNGTFQTKVDFTTASEPESVTLGDVNGDGILDIISANGSSANVSLLLGNGNGTFRAKTDFATGSLPRGVTFSDVNSDGRLDIITANRNSNTVSVLLGNGNGTFQTQATYATGSQPSFVTLGDVNGDGRLDLITANSGTTTASVLLGNGNGTFQTKADFTTGSAPYAVALSDMNGDGKLDLIVSNDGSNTASVLIGNGDGTFGAKTDFSTGVNPRSVQVGDVNGDGRLDIVTANNGSATVSVLSSIIAFTGQTATVVPTPPFISSPTSASIGNTSATLGGNVTATGNASLTAVGVVYAITSANSNPQLNGTGVINVAGTAATGVFTVSATVLTAGTAYSYAAYATNSVGTTYTSVGTFTTTVPTPTLTFTTPTSASVAVGATRTNAANSTLSSGGYGAITYTSSDTSKATVNATTGVVTGLAVGTTTITATQAAAATFNATSSTSYTLTVTIGTPTITAVPTATGITFGQTLAASTLSGGTASVAGTFAFTTPSTAPGVGTAAQGVTFTPTDSTNYTSTTTTANVTVAKATPTINAAPTASGITYGQTLASSTLIGGTASTTGTFTFTSTSTVPNAGTAAQGVTFTPNSTANYNTTTTNVNVTVAKATPTVTWATPGAIAYGTALSAMQLNATANVAGSFTYTPSIGTVLTTGTQTLSVGFTPTDAANYNAMASMTVSLTVGQTSQTITFGALAGKTYGDAAFTVSATASSGLSPTFSIVSGPATISGNTVTITGAGTVVVRASQAGDGNYTAATPVDQSFTVAKKTLTVTADAKSRAYGAANPTLTVTLTGFVNSETSAVVSGSAALSTTATATSTVSDYAITAAIGSLSATNYDFGFAPGTLTIVPAGQTITFPVIPDQSLAIGALTPPATASSGLAPVLTLVSGPATISSGTITLTGPGTVVVRASQAGDANYTAATPVDRAFTVLSATATVALGNLAATYDGTAKAATATTVPAGLAVALTYNGSPTAPTNAGSYAALATVTAANYTGSASGTLVIAPASQTLTLSAIPGKTFGDGPFTVSATASSGLAPAYSIVSGPATISGQTVTLTGVGTVVVRASQPGGTNFTAAAPADQSFTVAPAAATVALGNLAQTADGPPKSVTVTTAPAGLAVSVTYNGGAAPSAAGTYAVVATVTAANYTGGATGTLVLAPAATQPVITTQPTSLAVTAGATARFTVVATGNPTPAYQWRKNGTAIPNATAATLTLPNVQAADATSYDVVVSNSAGAVTSTAAILAVSPANFAGTYFGTLGSEGTFALYLRPDNTGVFLAFIKGVRTAFLSRAVTVDSQGRFSFTTAVSSSTNVAGDRLPTANPAPNPAAAEAVFTGTIAADGTLSGLGAGLVLSAQKSPATGGSAAVAGLYETAAAGSSAQTLVIAGTGGQAFALALTPNGPDAGTGTVSATGQVAVTTAAGQTVAATVSPAAATVSATVIDIKGVTTVFTGLADNSAALAAQRLVNLSSRVRTAAGDQVAIAGFVIGGDQPKRVLIRAVGPALTQFGVAGALAAPKLDLYRGSTVIATNAAWGTAANATDIAAAAAGAGAFAFGAGSADSAVLTTLAPGAYTAIASSANGATGVALVEVYDLTAAVAGQKLVSLSMRAVAGTASETLIAGVFVGGTVPKRVLIRAAGPALAAFGVGGALARPKLELFSGANVIAQNTGWSTGTDAAGIAQAAGQVGAFAFAAGSADSALLINLSPGAYTAQVSGVGGTTGVALIEVYEVP